VYWKTLKKLHKAIQNKRNEMLTSMTMCICIQRLTLEHCWSISTWSCLTTLLTALISRQATTTCLPTWRTGCDHSILTIKRSWWKMLKHSWAHRRQTSLTQSYRNLFPDMTSTSIPVVTTLRSSLSMCILSRVGWHVWRKWQVLVRMIGFISPLATHSLLITFTTQAIQCYRWFTHFPVHRCARTRIFSLH
jgi:hypothetical protein